MKSLKQICESSLTHPIYEVSILADIDDQIDAYDNSIIDRIEKWIKENYNYSGLKISKKPNKDGLYQVTAHSVRVKNKNITSLTNGMFEWKEINNYFSCNKCINLKSLVDAPKTVRGSFECYKCTSLTSLEGAPKEVEGNFNCNHCIALKSLKGAPITVRNNFYCSLCSSLESLKGAPQEVGGDFFCADCSSLTSLEGAPKKVGGDFNCFNCNSLTSLEGAPKKVKTFVCFNCKKKFTKEDVEKISNVEVKIVI